MYNVLYVFTYSTCTQKTLHIKLLLVLPHFAQEPITQSSVHLFSTLKYTFSSKPVSQWYFLVNYLWWHGQSRQMRERYPPSLLPSDATTYSDLTGRSTVSTTLSSTIVPDALSYTSAVTLYTGPFDRRLWKVVLRILYVYNGTCIYIRKYCHKTEVTRCSCTRTFGGNAL